MQWAHFGTTESALVFLVVALWAMAARRLNGDLTDLRFALWTGVLLGLGFGFKTTVLVLAAIPVLTLVLLGIPDRARLWSVCIGAALTIVLALLSTPSIWAATAAWLEVMRFENGVVTGAVPVFWTAQFNGAVNGRYELGQLWRALSGVGVVLAVAGVALLPKSRRRAALPGLGFALIYAALTFGWHAKFFRYLAPLIPVLLIFAAVVVGRVLAMGKSKSVAALGIFQYISSVEIPEQRQRFLFVKPLQLCKTENLTRAVIFPRFIHRSSVPEFRRHEIVMFINIGNHFFKVDGFGGGFELV